MEVAFDIDGTLDSDPLTMQALRAAANRAVGHGLDTLPAGPIGSPKRWQ